MVLFPLIPVILVWPPSLCWSSQVLSIFFSTTLPIGQRKNNKSFPAILFRSEMNSWTCSCNMQKCSVISSTAVFCFHFLPSLYACWATSRYRKASQMSWFNRKRISATSLSHWKNIHIPLFTHGSPEPWTGKLGKTKTKTMCIIKVMEWFVWGETK